MLSEKSAIHNCQQKRELRCDVQQRNSIIIRVGGVLSTGTAFIIKIVQCGTIRSPDSNLPNDYIYTSQECVVYNKSNKAIEYFPVEIEQKVSLL